MNMEINLGRVEAEPQATSSASNSFEISEEDTLLCVRNNMARMLTGDEPSKELINILVEPTDENTLQLKCPASVCSAQYELDLSDGSEARQGDCAVVMSGIMKVALGGSRGMSFAEFAKTPLGKKTVK